MSKLVVKDNALIEASYTLDVAEQRLILLAILEAREQKTLIEAGSLLRIHASSYIHQFNVDRSTAYKVLKEAVEGLYEAGFVYSKADEITGKIGHYKSRWVDKVGYIDDLGCVELVFASDVIPLITRLEKRFTEYDIEQISGLQSRYAIRLYELLAQWRSVGKTPLITLKDLRNKLGLLESEYNRADNFKRRVLDLAVKQINERTDITAEYKQEKSGRKITGFQFSYKFKDKKEKKEKNVTSGRDPDTADMFTSYTDKQLARAVHSKKFIADYNGLVSAQNPANQSSGAWVSHMVEWVKKDPERFTKRPMQEYLDDEQAQRF